MILCIIMYEQTLLIIMMRARYSTTVAGNSTVVLKVMKNRRRKRFILPISCPIANGNVDWRLNFKKMWTGFLCHNMLKADGKGSNMLQAHKSESFLSQVVPPSIYSGNSNIVCQNCAFYGIVSNRYCNHYFYHTEFQTKGIVAVCLYCKAFAALAAKFAFSDSFK